MKIEDRLNPSSHWAGGWKNVAFIAGRLHANPDSPRLALIQQTVLMTQSIPFVIKTPIKPSDAGSYVSVFARLRGRVGLDAKGFPVDAESMLMPEMLHMRAVNAVEMNADDARERLLAFVRGLPQGVQVDTTLKGMVVVPPEGLGDAMVNANSQPEGEASQLDDPFALTRRDKTLIQNGNLVDISGVIGAMRFRDGGDTPSNNCTTIWVQQNASLAEALEVRIYGRQAALVADNYLPGHIVHVQGSMLVDYKKNPVTQLSITRPYIKTFSVEVAQPKDVRFNPANPFPEWVHEMVKKYNRRTNEGLAALASMRRSVKAVKLPPRADSASPPDTGGNTVAQE